MLTQSRAKIPSRITIPRMLSFSCSLPFLTPVEGLEQVREVVKGRRRTRIGSFIPKRWVPFWKSRNHCGDLLN